MKYPIPKPRPPMPVQTFGQPLQNAQGLAPQPTFMQRLGEMSPALLQASAGLLSGRTGPEQFALGAQGFGQGAQGIAEKREADLKKNKTFQWLEKNATPEELEAVRAGLTTATDLFKAKTSQTAQKPMSTLGKLGADRSAGFISDDQYDAAVTKATSTSPLVTINGEPNDSKLRNKLNEKTGESWAGYLDTASNSAAMAGDMALLDELIQLAPQGPLQGRLAEAFPGFSSAGSAFNSIVKRLAPTLRAPGSGSTSDIEYDGMLKSLPALANKPEANAVISQIMKEKAQINIERGEIVTAYSSGQITANQARAAMAELNERSIMTPEMQQLINGLAPVSTGNQTSSGVNWSVE